MMKNMKHIMLLLLLMTCFTQLSGNGRPIAVVPFDLSGSYIIISARVNQGTSLQFIFDTGLRHSIITHLDENDVVNLNNQRKVPLQGLGQGLDLVALASDNNVLSMGNFSLKNLTVFVLEEDFLQLSEMNGRKINGIVGVDLLKPYVVQIDYTNRRLRFYKPEGFTAPKKYKKRQLFIENNKILMMMTLLDSSLKLRTIKMLIDTGARLNAWFQTVTGNFESLPEKKVYTRIGTGFSGDVYGYLAKIPQICLEEHCFNHPIVAFPDSAVIAELVRRSDRDGSIGSELLSRFDLYIDFPGSMMYFKPNDRFKLPFRYNIAGIEISQSYFPLPGFSIANVWKNSPADRAGLKTGDVIIGVNGENAIAMTMNELLAIFEQPSRRPMQVVITRENKTIQFQVEMRDLL